MSRSNEILTALLRGGSVQWRHLVRLDHQDLLGTFNVAVGEVLGARVESSLSIRSRATQFIAGRIGGGLTMSFSSFLEACLGSALGWTHEEALSNLSAKSIIKSIAMDTGFRLGHTLFALPFSNSHSAYAERLRSRADLRQIERQDLRQAGHVIAEGARQAPYILVGVGMGMGAGVLRRPRFIQSQTGSLRLCTLIDQPISKSPLP
ncbi:MAG: hypothetical protein HQM15_06280 [Deltaproteobacteria bacterium]|nr:hypothetical protein [Deltaproteobacteria bacterium]